MGKTFVTKEELLEEGIKLKPCPFCGNEPETELWEHSDMNSRQIVQTRCTGCYANIEETSIKHRSVNKKEHLKDLKEYSERWNKRPSEEDILKLLESLQKILTENPDLVETEETAETLEATISKIKS